MLKRLLLLMITLVILIGGGYYFFGTYKETNIKQIELTQIDPVAQRLYQKLQITNFVEQGQQNAPQSMYVIFDPNCIFCHILFEATQKQVDSGQLIIRWVPIGIISRSSPFKAMAILSAESPIEALKENEDGFNYWEEEGGIRPIKSPSNKEMNLLNHNMAILIELINAVPVVVYKNTQNQERISDDSLFPLQATKLALANNEQKVTEFVKNIGKSW